MKHVRTGSYCHAADIAFRHSIVTDGRDVGSVVFPQADFKFFITASVLIRAERWRKDQEKYGNHISIDEAIALITDRDNRDKNREVCTIGNSNRCNCY